MDGYAELASRLVNELDTRILFLYGPVDIALAKEIMSQVSVPFTDGGLHPSLLEFFAYMDICDIVVTGDTFALHAALGLKKRVVCLVGPTSAAELELYDQGVILQGPVDCLGCYLTECQKNPTCMQSLHTETVFKAIQRELGADMNDISAQLLDPKNSWRNHQRIRFIKGFYITRKLVDDLFNNFERTGEITHEEIDFLLESHIRHLKDLSHILYRMPDDKAVDRKKQRIFDKVFGEMWHELDKARDNIRLIESLFSPHGIIEWRSCQTG